MAYSNSFPGMQTKETNTKANYPLKAQKLHSRDCKNNKKNLNRKWEN